MTILPISTTRDDYKIDMDKERMLSEQYHDDGHVTTIITLTGYTKASKLFIKEFPTRDDKMIKRNEDSFNKTIIPGDEGNFEIKINVSENLKNPPESIAIYDSNKKITAFTTL